MQEILDSFTGCMVVVKKDGCIVKGILFSADKYVKTRSGDQISFIEYGVTISKTNAFAICHFTANEVKDIIGVKSFNANDWRVVDERIEDVLVAIIL